MRPTGLNNRSFACFFNILMLATRAIHLRQNYGLQRLKQDLAAVSVKLGRQAKHKPAAVFKYSRIFRVTDLIYPR